MSKDSEYGYLSFDGTASASYKTVELPQPTTAGAECIKVYEKYAARHRGKRRSFLARLADSVRGRK
jgi:hypothetical protein